MNKNPLAVILKEAKLGEAKLRGEKASFTYTAELRRTSYALLFPTKLGFAELCFFQDDGGTEERQ